jgi:hypothetical protein
MKLLDTRVITARIVIYKNVTVLHYYFNYLIEVKEGDKTKKFSNKGKWSAYFVNEKNLWFMISDFTFSETDK